MTVPSLYVEKCLSVTSLADSRKIPQLSSARMLGNGALEPNGLFDQFVDVQQEVATDVQTKCFSRSHLPRTLTRNVPEKMAGVSRTVRSQSECYMIAAKSCFVSRTQAQIAEPVIRSFLTFGRWGLGQSLKYYCHKGDAVGGTKKSRADSEKFALR